jgi:predicted MFS family arabinose efflux permease
MAQRATEQDSGAVSAMWNSGIDLGSSVGGSLIGLAAANFGYGAAAWVLPATAVLAVPLFLWRKPPMPSRVDPELSPLARG